ncbi:hypothetical protein EVA_13188 [gut metagenome]|uniref:Uncharacterized protein n=1 Tax=gut metagenome TaxID=749906 RepID=J9FW04_9ZZZZ
MSLSFPLLKIGCVSCPIAERSHPAGLAIACPTLLVHPALPDNVIFGQKAARAPFVL